MKIVIETYIKTRDDYDFCYSVKKIIKNRILYNYNSDFKYNFSPIDKVSEYPITEGMYDYIEGAIVFYVNDVKITDWENWDDLVYLWAFLYREVSQSSLLKRCDHEYADTYGILTFIPLDSGLVDIYYNEEKKASVDRLSLMKAIILEADRFFQVLWQIRPKLIEDYDWVVEFLEQDKRKFF
ncbi:hypothetical protein HBN50_02925 [Halobacteriovorax sp. GB3]|uniref:hypothetical protein n=1 Tax=Halobacteriovorax sp. GB3 TaxID=2719615 RepID=UPI002363076B|nr:hypothetical protein [Halobacteriovorax sp. GB3]MDD0852028.1 hypothetical protein [Halobacteriovorax sp. GB3]